MVVKKLLIALTIGSVGLLVAQDLARSQTLPKVKVGTVRATTIGAVVSAKEKGYFKEAGIDVDIELIDASAAFVPALATNALNVVEGGVSASLFNGILQGLPIKSAFDSTSTPINHYLMRRPDLAEKYKSIKDLKGAVVAVNAPSSIALYEVTKLLETEGLSIKDVEVKVIPFAQMGIAFQTKAIEVGLQITPFASTLEQQGIATRWISSDRTLRPTPVQISTSMYNTDWAAQNPKVAQAFFTQLLRGARDYCNAYHGGSYRPELLKLLVANGVAPSTDILDKILWPARNPDGHVFKESMTDVLKWYVGQGLVRSEIPIDQVVNDQFAAEAVKQLGAFKLENTSSELGGCGRPQP